MNSNTDLIKYAKQLRIPLRYVGTKDKLKEERLHDGGYILNLQDDYNTDGTDQLGTHWTSFYVERGKAVYFNSFGMSPPAEVQLFLWKLRPIAYNQQHIQNIRSGWCGIYVLAFLRYMMTHKHIPLYERLQKFVDQFSDDVEDNLTILKKIMGKQFFN